jgi:hypothetical protein
VAVLWGYVEMLQARLLAKLCGAETTAMLSVAAEIPRESLSVAIARLARQKLAGEILDELVACLTDADVLRREPDMLVHGRWDRGLEPGTAVITTSHPARREVVHVVSL